MAEKPAATDRSLDTIKHELEMLRNSGALKQEQFSSITAQLPAPGGYPSNYVDARFVSGSAAAVSPELPQAIALQAQDPNHPANPSHPEHLDWAKKLAAKFGNAVVWGGGATLGSDVVNSAWNAL